MSISLLFHQVLDLQQKVENITVYVPKLDRYASLSEICYKPLDPDFSACALFSPLEYLQTDASKLASKVGIFQCFCRKLSDDHFQAEAVIITLMTKNFLDHDSDLAAVTFAWEAAFIELVRQWKLEHLKVIVSFKAERSVEDEIDRQSHSDISTVLISYVVMFAYVSVSLGSYHSWRTIMVSISVS
ncbi:unnamed protein product [Dibothriocephalus latus]|uniref:NPC1 middle luminal domain-containing protein n=1 Tax=Dibothriocephalus latus TaxID=60516 RepID=A0A3P7M9K8_DIBLA|nr:unnamed protein product [Dibothriocephalus latus]